MDKVKGAYPVTLSQQEYMDEVPQQELVRQAKMLEQAERKQREKEEREENRIAQQIIDLKRNQENLLKTEITTTARGRAIQISAIGKKSREAKINEEIAKLTISTRSYIIKNHKYRIYAIKNVFLREKINEYLRSADPPDLTYKIIVCATILFFYPSMYCQTDPALAYVCISPFMVYSNLFKIDIINSLIRKCGKTHSFYMDNINNYFKLFYIFVTSSNQLYVKEAERLVTTWRSQYKSHINDNLQGRPGLRDYFVDFDYKPGVQLISGYGLLLPYDKTDFADDDNYKTKTCLNIIVFLQESLQYCLNILGKRSMESANSVKITSVAKMAFLHLYDISFESFFCIDNNSVALQLIGDLTQYTSGETNLSSPNCIIPVQFVLDVEEGERYSMSIENFVRLFFVLYNSLDTTQQYGMDLSITISPEIYFIFFANNINNVRSELINASALAVFSKFEKLKLKIENGRVIISELPENTSRVEALSGLNIQLLCTAINKNLVPRVLNRLPTGTRLFDVQGLEVFVMDNDGMLSVFQQLNDKNCKSVQIDLDMKMLIYIIDHIHDIDPARVTAGDVNKNIQFLTYACFQELVHLMPPDILINSFVQSIITLYFSTTDGGSVLSNSPFSELSQSVIDGVVLNAGINKKSQFEQSASSIFAKFYNRFNNRQMTTTELKQKIIDIKNNYLENLTNPPYVYCNADQSFNKFANTVGSGGRIDGGVIKNAAIQSINNYAVCYTDSGGSGLKLWHIVQHVVHNDVVPYMCHYKIFTHGDRNNHIFGFCYKFDLRKALHNKDFYTAVNNNLSKKILPMLQALQLQAELKSKLKLFCFILATNSKTDCDALQGDDFINFTNNQFFSFSKTMGVDDKTTSDLYDFNFVDAELLTKISSARSVTSTVMVDVFKTRYLENDHKKCLFFNPDAMAALNVVHFGEVKYDSNFIAIRTKGPNAHEISRNVATNIYSGGGDPIPHGDPNAVIITQFDFDGTLPPNYNKICDNTSMQNFKNDLNILTHNPAKIDDLYKKFNFDDKTSFSCEGRNIISHFAKRDTEFCDLINEFPADDSEYFDQHAGGDVTSVNEQQLTTTKPDVLSLIPDFNKTNADSIVTIYKTVDGFKKSIESTNRNLKNIGVIGLAEKLFDAFIESIRLANQTNDIDGDQTLNNTNKMLTDDVAEVTEVANRSEENNQMVVVINQKLEESIPQTVEIITELFPTLDGVPLSPDEENLKKVLSQKYVSLTSAFVIQQSMVDEIMRGWGTCSQNIKSLILKSIEESIADKNYLNNEEESIQKRQVTISTKTLIEVFLKNKTTILENELYQEYKEQIEEISTVFTTLIMEEDKKCDSYDSEQYNFCKSSTFQIAIYIIGIFSYFLNGCDLKAEENYGITFDINEFVKLLNLLVVYFMNLKNGIDATGTDGLVMDDFVETDRTDETSGGRNLMKPKNKSRKVNKHSKKKKNGHTRKVANKKTTKKRRLHLKPKKKQPTKKNKKTKKRKN